MTPERELDATALAVALEGVLSRIAGVRAARVVADGSRIAEIHIVASTDRAPKQLVRDVQSAAKASLDVEIDYRTVSIVQLEDEADAGEPGVGRATARLPLLRVVASTSGQLASIEVVLRQADLELVGRARGAAGATDELIARATLQAVDSMLGEIVGEVAGTRVVDVSEVRIAVVTVRLISASGTRLVSGSAVVGSDVGDAIARATLDAVNRLAS